MQRNNGRNESKAAPRHQEFHVGPCVGIPEADPIPKSTRKVRFHSSKRPATPTREETGNFTPINLQIQSPELQQKVPKPIIRTKSAPEDNFSQISNSASDVNRARFLERKAKEQEMRDAREVIISCNFSFAQH